jgi:hypothetical protein
VTSRAECISSFSVTARRARAPPAPKQYERLQQVHAGVAAKRACRTLGADHDDGLVGLEGQVEEVSRFLQGRRAVRNNQTSEFGPFGGEPMDTSMLSRPSDEMVPPQPMAAIKGLSGIIPPKSPPFRSDNATNREDPSGASLHSFWRIMWPARTGAAPKTDLRRASPVQSTLGQYSKTVRNLFDYRTGSTRASEARIVSVSRCPAAFALSTIRTSCLNLAT